MGEKMGVKGEGNIKCPRSASFSALALCLSLGIWSAALNGDLGRVKDLIQKAVDPSQPDLAGYTALVSWEELGVLPPILLSQPRFSL